METDIIHRWHVIIIVSGTHRIDVSSAEMAQWQPVTSQYCKNKISCFSRQKVQVSQDVKIIV